MTSESDPGHHEPTGSAGEQSEANAAPLTDGTGGAAYYGGQAVIEGVMMRGQRCWAIAVRRPDSSIHMERHAVSDFPERHPVFKKPLVRGTYALVDALRIGTKALTISANASVDDSEQLSGKELGGSLIVALLLFIGVFIVLPNFGLSLLHERMNEPTYHVVEGVLRVVIFLAYLFAISLLADIRRVFQYHGAEHKTIAAWEHGEPLDPDRIDRYSTLHVRCGTNFLLLVMLIAIVVYSVAGLIVPAPAEAGTVGVAAYHIILRIVLLPVVAGLAYEGLRLGAGRQNILVRALMRPGLWLQMITTKPPSRDQIEIAVRAFEAVVPTPQLAGRTVAFDAPIVWGKEVGGDELGRSDEHTIDHEVEREP